METYDLDAHDPRPKQEEGVEMTVLDPKGRPTGAKLMVRGTDSQAFNDTLSEQVRKRAEMLPRKQTNEEKDEDFYELYATLVAGWPSGTFTKKNRDGVKQPFDYTPKNAAALLKQYPYIFEQVRRFADNRGNFWQGPESG